MTAAQELVAHPHAFVRHNLLQLNGTLGIPTPTQLQSNGTVLLKLEDYTAYYHVTRVRNRKGIRKLLNYINNTVQIKVTNFYVVSAANVGDQDTFSAYICPYADNQSHSIQLGNASNLMFTAEMTGCSFGVGIPGPHGDVLVTHSNEKDLATPTSTAPQEQGQLQQLQNLGTDFKMLQPSSYREFDAANDIDFRATTVGIRSGGKWEFWYQNYNATAGDRSVASVTRIR